MRVFLDACLDPRAARIFAAHEVRTAFELDWHKLKDHVLLSRVQGHFDVVVTLDKGFEFEHNQAIESKLQDAVNRVKAGQVIHVYTEDPRTW